MASWGPWEFIDRAFYSQSDLRKHHLQGLITSKFPAFATCSNIKTVSSVGGKKEKRSQSPNIHPQITATPHKRCLSGQTSHFPEWTCKFMQVLQSLIYSYMLCECLIVCCWITAPTKRQLLDKLDHITQKKNHRTRIYAMYRTANAWYAKGIWVILKLTKWDSCL